MNFSYYDFGYLEKGKIVEVQLSAAANVRLMDSTNYSNYKMVENTDITVAMSREVHTESQFPQQATGILLLI